MNAISTALTNHTIVFGQQPGWDYNIEFKTKLQDFVEVLKYLFKTLKDYTVGYEDAIKALKTKVQNELDAKTADLQKKAAKNAQNLKLDLDVLFSAENPGAEIIDKTNRRESTGIKNGVFYNGVTPTEESGGNSYRGYSYLPARFDLLYSGTPADFNKGEALRYIGDKATFEKVKKQTALLDAYQQFPSWGTVKDKLDSDADFDKLKQDYLLSNERDFSKVKMGGSTYALLNALRLNSDIDSSGIMAKIQKTERKPDPIPEGETPNFSYSYLYNAVDYDDRRRSVAYF